MELIGALLLVLAVALVVGLFVSRPFLRRETPLMTDDLSRQQELDHERSSLLAERDRVLNALHELDFDYALGKVPQEDYPEQRAILLHRGAEVLRQLDALGQGAESAAVGEKPALSDGSSQVSVEERFEAAVAARRADTSQRARPAVQATVSLSGNGKSASRDELEDLIASRKRARKESSAGFCPHCGRPVQKSDKFCSKCGANL
jgi:hypothetical protein